MGLDKIGNNIRPSAKSIARFTMAHSATILIVTTIITIITLIVEYKSDLISFPFDASVWGTVSDWVMIAVTIVTAIYLIKTFRKQQIITRLEQKRILDSYLTSLELSKIIYFGLALFALTACNGNKTESTKMEMAMTNKLIFDSGYSEVNGLKMYYEIYGQGKPLVLIHGGGSTIQSNFEKAIPLFAENRKVIAVELQAHGRTGDRDADLSFEQDADDIAALLKNLNIDKADFFGFSNGGTTTVQIAIRHPEIVDKVVLGSALAKRNGVPDWFWDFMKQAKLENMPEQLKTAYKQVATVTSGLQAMHDKDAKRMIDFKDIPDEQIRSIKAPTLIIIGDKDVITPEHALELHRQIAGSELAIIPGGHGEYIDEITTIKPDFKDSEFVVPLIEKFLNRQKE